MIARSLPLALVPLLAAASGEEERAYRQEPLVLGAHEPLVGTWIPDLETTALDGSALRLSQAAGPKGLVIALRDPECPVAQRHGPRLAALTRALPARGFGVLVVNVLSRESAERERSEPGLAGTTALDPEERLARALGARTTTEVFLLDGARTLRYRGMIDDQYGLGFAREEPENEWLERALAAVEAGLPVAVPATQAQGCLLAPSEEAAAALAVPLTWNERAGRIVQARCEPCHRAGGVAPFALETLAQVKKRSAMIEYVLQDGVMPPWYPEPGAGPWSNDLGFAAGEKEDLLAWIAAGCSEGDPAHAALSVRHTDGWTIGEPDLVVPIPEPVAVPAEGVVDYVYQYVRTEADEDRWVQAIEVRPGARSVVHHVLVFLEDPAVREAAEKGDRDAARSEQRGGLGFFASAAPGQTGVVFPPGLAKRLPARAWLKFQLHYTPNGTAATDRSELGLVFADAPPRAEVRTTAALDDSFAIPPGAFDHEVRASYRFQEDAAILSLLPHTHLRGRRFLYELVTPDGKTETLLHLPYYDFEWQLDYALANPRVVRAGTELHATAWFDNSEYNPANPDPTAWVRFGEQTNEEMMIGYVSWVPLGG